MAEIRDILGRAYTTATGITYELYVVPTAQESVISSIMACNQGTATGSVRIQAASATADPATFSHRLFWNVGVPAQDTLTITAGITLRSSGVIRVGSEGASGFSFNAFGTRIDV